MGMLRSKWKIIILIFVGVQGWGVSSCSINPIRQGSPPPASPVQTPAETVAPTETTSFRGTRIQQWASDAEASSEFSNPEWSAEKAAGPPDSPGCGDYPFAWASAASDSAATLTLTYSIPVFITQIEVVESFNPDQVVKVEVLAPVGDYETVYTSEPEQVDRPCPYRLTIPVEGLNYKSDVIRITVDQSVLGLGWNEIDAVQLTGVTER